jgi:hypothetical protein
MLAWLIRNARRAFHQSNNYSGARPWRAARGACQLQSAVNLHNVTRVTGGPLKNHLMGSRLAFLAAAALSACTAFAADSEQSAPAIAGWNEFIDGLRALPDRMLAKLPEGMRSDPQVQQEIGRLVLESVAYSTIDAIGGDGDHPVFLPASGAILNVGQPNADTVYRIARITPGGTYRLRGERGSLRLANIGQVGPTPGETGVTSTRPGPTRSYHDLNALSVDAQGRFDVLLSPARPAGYKGDWWQLLPATNKLLLRMVSSGWGREKDVALSIERLDAPLRKPRVAAAELERRLRQLPGATAFMALLFVDHVETLRQQGYVNKLKVFDVSQMGGLEGQFYYEGAYDLRDDEALIVEATVPKSCVYRSLLLTNELFETTDWYDNQSSLNDSQAQPDRDGILRVVVSARDPHVPNWLDIAGYPRGVVQGRWTGCDTQPIPTVRKVGFAELRSLLPPDTPEVTTEQRQALIRERRHDLQLRPLW